MPVTTSATSSQGKRNRRATCATWNCAESSACWCCVRSQSFATEARRHKEKPGIEEQHNTLSLTPITQNRSRKSEVIQKPKTGVRLAILRFSMINVLNY